MCSSNLFRVAFDDNLHSTKIRFEGFCWNLRSLDYRSKCSGSSNIKCVPLGVIYGCCVKFPYKNFYRGLAETT